MTLPFNPRAVPVVPSTQRLEPVVPQSLTPSALRQRFACPPQWVPEVLRERAWGQREPVEAAVLLTLVQREEPMLLLTQRAAHLNAHAGQVAFPGGKVDAADDGPVGAALREAWEEVGLAPRAVEVLGTLPAYVTGTSFIVTPVVGWVSTPPMLHANASEVAEVFEVPLVFLMNPDQHRLHRFRHEGVDREWYSMTYVDRGQERFIWGATAGMLRNFYRFLAAAN